MTIQPWLGGCAKSPILTLRQNTQGRTVSDASMSAALSY